MNTGRAAPPKAPCGGAEQRALERQEVIAVAGRALGKQHHGLAPAMPAGDLARLVARRPLALALDEDGALQLGQHTEAASLPYRPWR